MNVRQPIFPGSRFAALLLCLGLALAGVEAAAQGNKKVRAPWVGKTAEGAPCKGGQPTSGPFDYLKRRQFAGQLQVVEEHHFDSNVEKLIKGISTEPMGDIDFTLRAFPNHHRALQSAVKFRLMHKNWPERSKGVRAECYLQRAINFSPRDYIPYSLLGYTLHKLGKPDRAVQPYMKAIEMSPGDMMLKYNLALALTDLENYQAARIYAEQVYAVGFPLPALKRRLVEAGHWEDASEPPADAADAADAEDTAESEEPAQAEQSGRDKQAETATTEKPLSRKEQFARALAKRQAARESASDAAAGDDESTLSNREKFAAAIAALQAEREAAGAAEADTEEAEPGAGSEKTLSRKEKFAAALAAKQAEAGQAGPEAQESDRAGADEAGAPEPVQAAPEPSDPDLAGAAAQESVPGETEAAEPAQEEPDPAATGSAAPAGGQAGEKQPGTSAAASAAAIYVVTIGVQPPVAEAVEAAREPAGQPAAEPPGEPAGEPARAIAAETAPDKQARFAAAMAEQRARQASAGDQGATPTKAGGAMMTEQQKFAAFMAAARKNKAKAAKPVTKKQKFAAALARQKAAQRPKLSDLDPQARREQFAARLAAKGLLEDDTPGDSGNRVENTN